MNQMQQAKNERALLALKLKTEGMELASIAAHFGITKNGVRNLLGRAFLLTATDAEKDEAYRNAFSFMAAASGGVA